MKPVENEDFLMPFSKTTPKFHQKALGVSVKVEGVLRLCETSKSYWLNNVLGQPKKLIKIPYKTCRLLILPGPFFCKMASKSIKKALGFSLKVDDVL